MHEVTTITARIAEPTVRLMSPTEVPNVLPTSLRRHYVDSASDPLEAGRRREQVGWVAEVQGRLTGAVVCAVVQATASSQGANPLRWLGRLVQSLLGRRSDSPLYIELLNLAVEPTDEAVEQALLRRLLEELQGSWNRVPVVLPESNLAAQLFLRSFRYKAIRVLHAYFGDEDGYLMIDNIASRPERGRSERGQRWENLAVHG